MPCIPEQHVPSSESDSITALPISNVGTSVVTYAAYDKWQASHEAQQEYAVTAASINLVAVAERVSSNTGNADNRSDWCEVLDLQSEKLLARFAVRKPGTNVEMWARDTAAVAYAYLRLEHEPASMDVNLLLSAGVNWESLAMWFKAGVSQAYAKTNGQQTAAAHETLERSGTSFEDFGKLLALDCWEEIVIPKARRCRAYLIMAGHNTPPLTQDGKFGDEDLLPDTTLAKATVSRLYPPETHSLPIRSLTEAVILSVVADSQLKL